MSNAVNMATVDGLISTLLSGDVSATPVLEDAILAGISGAPKGAVFVAIMSKATKNEPAKREPNAFAIVLPGKSIRIFGIRYGQAYDRTFEVGDSAEYHCFNLHYHDRIKAITASTVTIHGKRLDLKKFNFHNYDFDRAQTDAENDVERMAI